MELESSLPHSQQPATCPYPEPARSSYVSISHSYRSILILSSHLCLDLPSGFLPPSLVTKTLVSLLYSIHATRSDYFMFRNSITRTIFGEQYRSLSSSLCGFLHSLVTSSFLGPNILLSTLFSNTQHAKLYFCIPLPLYFRIANWKGTDSALNDSKHSLTSICMTAASKYAFDTQLYGHIQKKKTARLSMENSRWNHNYTYNFCMLVFTRRMQLVC